MSRYTDTDRTLAFAGTYQAARLVHDLASTGQCDEKAFRITLDSLFVTQPEKVLDVWGGELENLRIGIETLVSQMMGSSRNLYITQYVLGLVVLAGKLQKSPEHLNALSDAIEEAKRQKAQFGEEHPTVVNTLAKAYQDHVSPLGPRIMVKGLPEHLNTPGMAEKIRALLLAGVRAAILWHQTGGSRWQLLWKRRRYLREAQRLLQQLPQKPLFRGQA